MITLNGQEIEIKRFPNGEARIEKKQLADAMRTSLSVGRAVITMKYQNDTDLFNLLLVRKAMWTPTELHIPYFPYSRMDRKSDSHVFTLKSVAKYINWLEFDKVFVYEPHSDVTPALLNKCTIVSLLPNLLARTDFNPDEDYVLYPDAGAHKHYADLIKIPKALIGVKQRDFATGRIGSYQIIGNMPDNKRVFIVDDLCSKGGTFVMAAEQLKTWNTTAIYLVVAHCEESIFKGEIFHSRLIEKVYTTDTILSSNMQVLSLPSLHITPYHEVAYYGRK